MNLVSPIADPAEVKDRQQVRWSIGDAPAIGTAPRIVGETLAEALRLTPGDRVIDIAAGVAARRLGDAGAAEDAPAWLRRCMAQEPDLALREADAGALPFADGAFDVATSTFGVMFAADPRAAAGEMMRVIRPGGRIGLANWTPDGFVGQVRRAIGRHAPEPAGACSPLDWGTAARMEALFGDAASEITVRSRIFTFRHRAAAGWVDVLQAVYGPLAKGFAAVRKTRGEAGAAALECDLIALAEAASIGDGRELTIPAEYAEIVIRKR